MNVFPKNADGTVLGGQEPSLILSPIPESEILKRGGIATVHGSANLQGFSAEPEPMNETHEFARAVEADPGIRRLDHVVTGADVSTMPGDEASIPSSEFLQKRSPAGRKGVVIYTILSLATGIAVGVAWSKTYVLEETISSVASKAEQPAQAVPVAATAMEPGVSEIAQRMDAIARDLSVVQKNIKELAAGQEKIRKAQEQLAETQSHLAVAQAQANAKQNKRPASEPMTDSRKSNRRDSHNRWR